MNSTGDTAPRIGWFHRSNASTPQIRCVARVEDRLVRQGQLAALERDRQVHAQLELAVGDVVHVGVEQRDPRLSVALRGVHRDVGRSQQIHGVCRALRAHDAGAGAHGEVAGAHVHRQGKALQRALREQQRFGFVGVFQQDGELVAAQPGNRVALAHAAAEALGDGSQQLVARGVTEAVVDRLEVVDVDQHHGGAHVCSCWLVRWSCERPVLPLADVSKQDVQLLL